MYRKQNFLTRFIGSLGLLIAANYFVMGLWDIGYSISALANWLREQGWDTVIYNFLDSLLVNIDLVIVISLIIGVIWVLRR